MRKERKIINTNIRLNLCDEQDQAGVGISCRQWTDRNINPIQKQLWQR